MLYPYYSNLVAGRTPVGHSFIDFELDDVSRLSTTSSIATVTTVDSTSAWTPPTLTERVAGSASADDFRHVADRLCPDMPVPPPGLAARDEQVRSQRAAVLREAGHQASRRACLTDVLQSLLGSGIDAGCFYAANAVALTAFARDGGGAFAGWEARVPEEAESYAEGMKKIAVASLAVAAPVAVALLLSRWLVRPVVGAICHAVSGRAHPVPTPAEVFYPDPSRCRANGSLRSEAEFEAAWRVVAKGRKAVLARQAQFAQGGLRDLACELAHPLAFALQGVVLDTRPERPGLLTVGGITLATASLATGLAETILGALKTSATFPGIDENGDGVSLRLFQTDEETSGSTIARRLRALPEAISKGVGAQYRAVTGGADGAAPAILAIAAECGRSVAAVLALNGATVLVDPLDAQFGRTVDEAEKVEVNAGFTLLGATVATVCFRVISGFFDRQRSHRTGRRELAQRARAFHAEWVGSHARQVTTLYEQVRHELEKGMPPTTADRIVFDELVEPMMKALHQELLDHRTLYVHARRMQPEKLRVDMLANHGHPDPSMRNTIYLDRLMKLPVEFPVVHALGRSRAPSRVPAMVRLRADQRRGTVFVPT